MKKGEIGNMKQKSWIGIVALVGLILLSQTVLGQVPQQINYQGYLTNAIGQSITDTLKIHFSIYSDQNRQKLLWSEDQMVMINRGIYNVHLGSKNEIPDSVFNGGIRYLGLKIENDPEMDQLIPILSVGYAFLANNADMLDGKHASSFIDSINLKAVTDSLDSLKRILSTSGKMINFETNPVDWTKLKNVPDEIADGRDSIGIGNIRELKRGKGISISDPEGPVPTISLVKVPADSIHNHNNSYYTKPELNLAGKINISNNPVDWSKLKNVPSEIADGRDSVGVANITELKQGKGILIYDPRGPIPTIRLAKDVADSIHNHNDIYYTIEQSKNYKQNDINARKLRDFEPGHGFNKIPISNGEWYEHLNADKLDNYDAGNSPGKIPINNGITNKNLNSDMLDSLHASNKINQIPINNGLLNENLNADLLDNFHASAFFDSLTKFKNHLREPGDITNKSNPVHWTKLKDVPDPIANITLEGFAGGKINGGLTIAENLKSGLASKSPNNKAISIESTPAIGIYVKKTTAHGLYVEYADSNGINIERSNYNAINVKSAKYEGLKIESSGAYGISINYAKDGGIKINQTGEDACGIQVCNAGGYGIKAKGNNGGGKFEAPSDLSKYALYVESYLGSPDNKALYVKGTSHFTGKAVSDVGFFNCNSSGNANYFLSSISSPDVEIFASGTAALVNGIVSVAFENEFSQSVSSDVPLKIILTPGGFAAGLLCVTKRSTQGFEVRLQKIPGLENFPEDVSFDWIAIGRRKGFEIRPNITLTDE